MRKIEFKDVFLGTHFYENCPVKEVEFLKHEHHHDFNITVSCNVTHENRDLEWIKLRVELKKFIKTKYLIKDEIVRFGGMSCESIGKDILNYFVIKYGFRNWCVKVSEDNQYTSILSELNDSKKNKYKTGGVE